MVVVLDEEEWRRDERGGEGGGAEVWRHRQRVEQVAGSDATAAAAGTAL